MLAFSMIKLEITVDASQKLIEAALIGPVRDIMHIQEGTLFIFYAEWGIFLTF